MKENELYIPNQQIQNQQFKKPLISYPYERLIEAKFFELLVFIEMVVLWVVTVMNEDKIESRFLIPIIFSLLYFFLLLFTFVPEYLCYPVKITRYNAVRQYQLFQFYNVLLRNQIGVFLLYVTLFDVWDIKYLNIQPLIHTVVGIILIFPVFPYYISYSLSSPSQPEFHDYCHPMMPVSTGNELDYYQEMTDFQEPQHIYVEQDQQQPPIITVNNIDPQNQNLQQSNNQNQNMNSFQPKIVQSYLVNNSNVNNNTGDSGNLQENNIILSRQQSTNTNNNNNQSQKFLEKPPLASVYQNIKK